MSGNAEGLSSNVKLHVALYRKNIYSILHGVSDAGSRLLFKLRSGTHGFDYLEIYAR